MRGRRQWEWLCMRGWWCAESIGSGGERRQGRWRWLRERQRMLQPALFELLCWSLPPSLLSSFCAAAFFFRRAVSCVRNRAGGGSRELSSMRSAHPPASARARFRRRSFCGARCRWWRCTVFHAVRSYYAVPSAYPDDRTGLQTCASDAFRLPRPTLQSSRPPCAHRSKHSADALHTPPDDCTAQRIAPRCAQ